MPTTLPRRVRRCSGLGSGIAGVARAELRQEALRAVVAVGGCFGCLVRSHLPQPVRGQQDCFQVVVSYRLRPVQYRDQQCLSSSPPSAPGWSSSDPAGVAAKTMIRTIRSVIRC
jgi:hypothetical protein